MIGAQDFVKIRQGGYFYVDKTDFIRRWRLSGADVTLITRPRRFGKTLMMNTVERFFSNAYADQADLFSGLAVWKDAQTRSLAGAFPVVALSFSTLKVATVLEFQNAMMAAVCDIYQRFDGLRNSPALSEEEREFFKRVTRWETEGKQELPAGGERTAVMGTLQIAMQKLCLFLHKHYGRKVIVLLDEYDTPMQEAWLHGYWDEISLFMRRLMNATFKDNNHLERGLLTGITRVSKESIFSDLNNIDVITTTSDDYADSFGFTQAEVAEAMAEYGLTDFEGVKRWYDGFTTDLFLVC